MQKWAVRSVFTIVVLLMGCTAHGQLLVDEVFPGRISAATDNSFIELYNAGTSLLDLSGCQVQAASSTSWNTILSFPAGLSMPSHGHLLLAAPQFSAKFPQVQPDWVGNLPVPVDETATVGVRVLGKAGNLLDTVLYGWPNRNSLQDDTLHPAEFTAHTPLKGSSVVRRAVGVDTQNCAQDFTTTATPQPMSSRSQAAPPMVATPATLPPGAPIPAFGQPVAGAASSDLGPPTAFRIFNINVGQGDSTLFVAPNGHALLMDGGKNGQGYGAVIPLMKQLQLPALDYMVASHYDADHIGGLDEVIQGGYLPKIAAFDHGGVKEKSTITFQDYLTAVTPVRKTIEPGEKIELGDGVEFECVAVDGKTITGEPIPGVRPEDENDYCVALLVRYGSFEYFIGGDLAGYTDATHNDDETSIAESVGDVDVLHVSHHGSEHSSNPAFLSVLKPEVGIISVGKNNYGHPSQAAIDRLHQAGAIVYQTGAGWGGQGDAIANGTILIWTNGRHYVVEGGTIPPTDYPVDELAKKKAATPTAKQ